MVAGASCLESARQDCVEEGEGGSRDPGRQPALMLQVHSSAFSHSVNKKGRLRSTGCPRRILRCTA
jgi:hypothetical protein